MKNRIPKQFFLLNLIFCLIILSACRKLEKTMFVSTGEVTNIFTNSAETSGKVIDLGVGTTQYGHCFSTTPNVSVTVSKTELGVPVDTGDFTSHLTNLLAGTTYYIKAYISNGNETVYGKEISFSTISASLPSVSTTAFTSVTSTSVSCGGNIISDGGASVSARGVCWNKAAGPTTSNSNTSDGIGTGSFVSNLSGLTPGTTYYVRAYATNSAGTAYGNELSFTTNPVIPTLTTMTIGTITIKTAGSGGEITNDGGALVTERGVCWNSAINPTINNTKTTDGSGSGNFISSLIGLTTNITYFVRAYATNSAGTAYGNEISFVLWINQPGPQVNDIDGNTYNSVKIGNQVWMSENLRTTNLNNATTIPLVTGHNEWIALSTPGYCWYNNDEANYKITFGALYNWYSVNTGNLCPTGWHLPTDTEWQVLVDYLEGSNLAGGKLKDIGTTQWVNPNAGATNESGFTALPGGYRSSDGGFNQIFNDGEWWTSTEYNTSIAKDRYLYSTGTGITISGGGNGQNKGTGASIRCIKDF